MAWLTGWSYRKSHNITGATGAGTDYQVKVTTHKHIAQYLTDWTKDESNPLVDPGDNRVWPAIVYTDNTYHLFLGHFSDGSDITYWTASDGQNFTEDGDSPIITRSDVQTAWSLGNTPTALEPHSVIWFDNKWWLYFGVKYSDTYWRIGYATTTDFSSWTLSSSPCLEPSASEVDVADPHALVYDSKVYLYYASSGLSANTWQLCGAWSTDGINFTKFGEGTSYLVDNYIPGGFVALDNGISGLIRDRGTTGYPYKAVFTADGETLSWYVNNPVLEYDTGSTWEAQNLGHPAICKVGDTYYAYYVGKDANDVCKLGRASTSTITDDTDSDEDVYLGNHCTDFPSDITFTDDDGVTELDHWLESSTAASATFWVEVKDDLGSNQSIYIYYGKSGQASQSNGADTFIAFEDFEWGSDGDSVGDSGGSISWTDSSSGSSYCDIDTSQKWGGTRSLESYRDGTNAAPASFPLIAAGSGIADYAIRWRMRKEDAPSGNLSHGDGNYRLLVSHLSGDDIKYYDTAWRDTGSDLAYDTWGLFEVNNIDWDNHQFDIWFNDSEIQANAGMQSTSIAEDVVDCRTSGTGSSWYDNVIIRKYVDPEPAHGSWGSEETAVEVPQATTQAATDVTSTTARINGQISDDGNDSCEARFRYKPVEDTLYEYYDTDDNNNIDTEGEWYYSQTFTPQESHSISKVSLKLFRTGDAGIIGDFVVSIHPVDDDSKPIIGTTYTSGSIDSADIATGSPGSWYEIELTPYDLTADVEYGLVIHVTGGDHDNNIDWRMSNTAGYPRGVCWYSADYGSTWGSLGDYDFMFKEYGSDWTYTDWQNTLETDDTYYEDLTELEPDTEYEFQTQAKNSAGEGEWSALAYFTTKAVVAISMDVLLRAQDTASVDLDTYLRAEDTETISLDALIKALGISKSVALDIILGTGGIVQIDLDAYLQGTNIESVNLDALVAAIGLTKTVALDAILAQTATQTVDLDALFKGAAIQAIDLDIIVGEAAAQTVSIDIILIRALEPSHIYTVEVRNDSGDLLAILENAHEISYTQAINSPHSLSLKLPADDSKASNILLANEYWLRDNRTDSIIKKFKLRRKVDARL